MKILDIPRSGSYQGITSSHNRAGQYVRNRRTPTNAPTARRTLIRSAFAAASSGWSALTPTEQASWIAAADAHPIVDALGQTIKLTGHQLYVSCATQLSNCGATALTTPPPDFAVFDASGDTGTANHTSGIALTCTGLGTSDDFLLVSFSKPTSAGRTYNAGWSQNSIQTGDTTTVAVSAAAYGLAYGALVAGQKVFCRLTPVNQYGVTGTSLVIPMVVA